MAKSPKPPRGRIFNCGANRGNSPVRWPKKMASFFARLPPQFPQSAAHRPPQSGSRGAAPGENWNLRVLWKSENVLWEDAHSGSEQEHGLSQCMHRDPGAVQLLRLVAVPVGPLKEAGAVQRPCTTCAAEGDAIHSDRFTHERDEFAISCRWTHQSGLSQLGTACRSSGLHPDTTPQFG